jgi:hypothetical protein
VEPAPSQTSSAAGRDAWKADGRCSTTQLVLQEKHWIDERRIVFSTPPSSKILLSNIEKAQAAGGTRDEVISRFLSLMASS